MSQQTIKQRARQQALDVAARRRRERAAREKKLQDLSTTAITAVLERDEFVALAEQRAGAALREMTEVEGLTLREAVEWCGEVLTEAEARRLRQITADADAGAPVSVGGAQDGGAGGSTSAR